jgi:hypothetical protein
VGPISLSSCDWKSRITGILSLPLSFLFNTQVDLAIFANTSDNFPVEKQGPHTVLRGPMEIRSNPSEFKGIPLERGV